MKKIGPITLPTSVQSLYDRSLSQALYKVLNELRINVNELIDEATGVQYATRYDQIDATQAFFGEAAVGASTSDAVWRIKQLEIGGDGDVTITWADGNSAFDNVWDDRASLSYS